MCLTGFFTFKTEGAARMANYEQVMFEINREIRL